MVDVVVRLTDSAADRLKVIDIVFALAALLFRHSAFCLTSRSDNFTQQQPVLYGLFVVGQSKERQ